jgi:Flp pilus assembly protein TadG
MGIGEKTTMNASSRTATSGKAGAGRTLARFARDRRGSTAIEFAALAIPFALLVFAILESCISFAGQEVMANATDDVARQLRTGQIKTIDAAGLKQRICGDLSLMAGSDCANRMSVDLRHYSTFADAAKLSFTITNGAVVLTKDGVMDSQQFTVDPGLSGTKNMLRVFYKWPVITDFMARSMANLNNNSTLHFASVTWQNEPFDN